MFKKLFFLTIILIGLAPSVHINAQQLQGLTITPAIYANSQNAGETKSYTFKIFSDVDRTIETSIKTLSKTSNYSQSIINENISPEFLQLFQNFQKQIFIKKDVENDYSLTIKLPDYFLGNYNFALVFEESSPQVVDTENVTEASSQVAIPFILNVLQEGAPLYENLSISKYDINPVLAFDGKNSFDISLKNEGISYLVPRGVLSIKGEKILGSYREQDVSINEGDRIVLKDGSLDLNFANNFEQNSIGQYKATLTVVYGLQNDIVTKEVYFWVFPQWFIVGVVILALVIVYMLFATIYKRKKLK